MPDKPPKEWWDKHYDEVKKGNPDYSDEQVRKTVGDIWYHKMSPSKKTKETKKSEGSVKTKAGEPGWDDHDLDQNENDTLPSGPIKIKLDNLDHEDGLVLVTAEWEDVQNDQSIEGTMWEHDDDFAYALIMDEPGLVDKLTADGYEVDDSEYFSVEASKKTAAFKEFFSSDVKNWIQIESFRRASKQGFAASEDQAKAYLHAAVGSIVKDLQPDFETAVNQITAENEKEVVEQLMSAPAQQPQVPPPVMPAPPGAEGPSPAAPAVEPASLKKVPMTFGLQQAFEKSNPEAFKAISEVIRDTFGEGFEKNCSMDELIDVEEDVLAVIAEEKPDFSREALEHEFGQFLVNTFSSRAAGE